ncbi:hypothetical protein M3Y97_00248400 [Aphelenchoides bicaudatus]|nr:hypothetical protein M3Y97_00248400 [Aphelenchoides bicaudatus]
MHQTKVLLEKVETEQRSKLQQLSAGQEEQNKTQDFTDIFNQTSSSSVPMNSDVSDLFASLDKQSGIGQTALSQNVSPSCYCFIQRAPLSLEEKKRLAAEQEFQRSQRSTPTLGSMSQQPIKAKSPTNTALNNDDFDLFGLKPSGSANGQNKSSTALDMFDPFSTSQKPVQSNNNLFAVNNTFGSLPQPPSVSNPISRNQPMIPQNSGFANFQKQAPDPFDNLFSLKSAVQNPSMASMSTASANNATVTKKNDPLDFLN